MRLESDKKRVADKLAEKMAFIDTLLAQLTVRITTATKFRLLIVAGERSQNYTN
jgi:hypothetical protein